MMRWKKGFYHIAAGAGVPIVLAFMDYSRKAVGLGPTIDPSGDQQADLAEMKAFFATIKPKRKEKYCENPE